jgi:putative ABC transport system ATP-binding protein
MITGGKLSAKFIWQKPSRDPLINLKEISKIYRNAAGEFVALKNINLDFYKGEFVGVIGKSGSGKSTLVNMVTGIDRPTEGKVIVEGVDVHAMRESKQARWRGLNLGVVFQFFQLLPMLTLVENILLPMDFCNKYPEDQRFDRAIDLLAMVGLEGDAHKLPGAVSGGQQQSAAIARALANDPPIIIADEPTGNLDAKTADSVYDKFESLVGEGRTIIMITHDPEIEHRLSRKVLLSDGEIIDPLLASVFYWFPRPVLRQLTHEIHSESYGGGASLVLSAESSKELILIESGRVQITHREGLHKDKHIILNPGDFFSGNDLIPNPDLQQYSAKVESDQATLNYLPFDSIRNLLISENKDHLEKMENRLVDNLLGRGVTESEKEGLIQ